MSNQNLNLYILLLYWCELKNIITMKKKDSILIEVETDLKTDVKVKCAKKGISMRKAIEDLLKEWVKK